VNREAWSSRPARSCGLITQAERNAAIMEFLPLSEPRGTVNEWLHLWERPLRFRRVIRPPGIELGRAR
jgi:hypothetical protein